MTYAIVMAGIAIAALVLYSLTGGADFGGGVWDLLAFGPRARAQREVIARAVAPIWEANHVWLIFVIVVLFVCFTPTYAVIATALHVPLTVMLFGIVLRGSAFAFRSHDYGTAQRRWDLLFAVASLVTPITLGVCIGAIASGTIEAAPDGSVRTDFVSSWLAPFPIAVSLFTLAQFAFLGATYLILEAEHEALRDDFRARALAAAVAAGVLAWVVVGLARSGAPVVFHGLMRNIPLMAAVSVSALGAFAALWVRRYRLARTLAMAQVGLVVLGWAFAQYPYLVVPGLTIDNARSSDAVLRMTLVVLGAGSLVLLPSFVYLYAVFKDRVR